jgi:hypothetical protein
VANDSAYIEALFGRLQFQRCALNFLDVGVDRPHRYFELEGFYRFRRPLRLNFDGAVRQILGKSRDAMLLSSPLYEHPKANALNPASDY